MSRRELLLTEPKPANCPVIAQAKSPRTRYDPERSPAVGQKINTYITLRVLVLVFRD